MQNGRQFIVAGVLSGALLCASVAQAAKELNDAEMDNVHAGATTELEPGEELVSPASENSSVSINNSVNTITLGQNAQQNLSSFVNVLAINSAVQVLMNVNVAINSTVGSVSQGNAGSQTQ